MDRAPTLDSIQPARPFSADLAWPKLEVAPNSASVDLRLPRRAAMTALAAIFLVHLTPLAFVDPDLWHEMALAREIFARGSMPLVDDFAYTPTVDPVVHHEWGTGVVLYVTSLVGGAPALMALKYALSYATAWLCFAAARRSRASWEVLLTIAPITILAGVIGFTTIRAQLFTLLFLALLFNGLAHDRRLDASPHPRRRWLWIALPLFVLWLNMHAGFVVGLGILFLATVERWWTGRPVRHLIVAGVASAVLVAANPYGFDYYSYLWHGLTMPRPLITEWQPLRTEPGMFRVYLATLLLTAYVVLKIGPRNMPYLAILLVCAYLAARHTRHVSIYLVAWLCLMPGYVQRTPLAATIGEFWRVAHRWILGFTVTAAALCLARAVRDEPWRLVIPTTHADEQLGRPVYPVGAVEYLRDVGFAGNLFNPFTVGGYLLYQLHPQVKVSVDGRYEVAYQAGIVEENTAFYDAKPLWRKTLDKYPTDLVLTPRAAPIAGKLAAETEWRACYSDDVYMLYARPGTALPHVERRCAGHATSYP